MGEWKPPKRKPFRPWKAPPPFHLPKRGLIKPSKPPKDHPVLPFEESVRFYPSI